MVKFWLGTHVPNWFVRTYIPLFVSRHRLAGRKSYPRAAGEWALDSGGFSELSLRGAWTVSPSQYVSEVRTFQQEIGKLKWAAAQDYMCEPFIVTKTGLTVEEHQKRTVCNYLELRTLAPELPWVPVLQGFKECEYLRCLDLYGTYGVDLTLLPLVGLGSVCRRQGTAEVEALIRRLTSEFGLRLHGFGFKVEGMKRVADVLVSADSMAWSMAARRSLRLSKCYHDGNCANCLDYALQWRRRLLQTIKEKRAELSQT